MADEELDLTLNSEEASALYLIVQSGLDSLAQKKVILDEINLLPKEDRPEELKEQETLNGVLNLNKDLTLRGKDFLKQIGEIIIELEKPQGPIIMPKPKWGA